MQKHAEKINEYSRKFRISCNLVIPTAMATQWKYKLDNFISIKTSPKNYRPKIYAKIYDTILIFYHLFRSFLQNMMFFPQNAKFVISVDQRHTREVAIFQHLSVSTRKNISFSQVNCKSSNLKIFVSNSLKKKNQQYGQLRVLMILQKFWQKNREISFSFLHFYPNSWLVKNPKTSPK